MIEYLLEPWTYADGYGDSVIVLQVADGGYSILPVNTPQASTAARGRYIRYPEGIFGVFVDYKDELFVCFNGSIFAVNDIMHISSVIKLRERQLELKLKNEMTAKFSYLSMSRLLFNPSIFLDMIFLDMWELEFELPGWFYSEYIKGESGLKFIRDACLKLNK